MVDVAPTGRHIIIIMRWKLLLLCDSETSLGSVEDLIHQALPDAEVISARDTSTGLRLAAQQPPDAILLDALLPDLGGFEVCRRLNQASETSSIPTLLLTPMMVSASDRIRAFESGACGILSRPFSFRELYVQLAQLLGTGLWLGERAEPDSALELATRFRLLFSDAPDSTLLLNAEMEIIAANPAAGLLFGLPVKDLAEQHISELVAPCEEPAVVERLRSLIQGQDGVIDEFPFEAADSGFSREIVVAHRLEFQERPFVLLYVRDISGARRVAEAFHISQARAEAVLNTVVDGVITMDEHGIIESLNPAASRMFGYDATELLGRNVAVLMPEPYSSQHAGYLRRYLETGVRRIIGIGREAVGLRKDGTTFQIELAVSEVVVGSRRLFTGLVRDITERKRNEADRDRMATIIDQTQEAVMITDIHGNILYINPAFERETGYSCDEVVGKNPRLFTSGRHSHEFFSELWATIKAGGVWRNQVVNRHKNGSLIDVRQAISPIRNRDGKVVNFVSVWQDVTRERQLEEQVRQTQKMEGIGRLAGGIVHDFNNVLSAILGYGDILRDKIRGRPDLEMLADELLGNAARGTKLTRQLLTFCRRQPVEFRVVDLNEVVRSMDRLLRRTLGEDVELVSLFSDGPSPVLGDFGQLEQVLMNLAVNARDAMPDGGKLVVQTQCTTLSEPISRPWMGAKPGSYVLLSVRDTGVGMTREVLSHLFEPFFTTKPEGQGTGLGLALVYGIVKQHGGWAEVESEPGQGTEFRIYLPHVERAAIESAPSLQQETFRGNERILLVEDDEHVRESIVFLLESLGYQVIPASGGPEALALAETLSDPIDLVVADIFMPHMGGRIVIERLREILLDFKVLFISGFAHELVDLTAPGVRLLRKPFDRTQLAQEIRSLLDSEAPRN